MGLFKGIFNKSRTLVLPQLEMDPFSLVIPFLRTVIASAILGVGSVWSVGYYEAAHSAVTYYTLYYFCERLGLNVCENFSDWLANPWSIGVYNEATDVGGDLFLKNGARLLTFKADMSGLSNMIGYPIEVQDYCPIMASGTREQAYVKLTCLSSFFLTVETKNLALHFSSGDTFSEDKFASKGELASSSLLVGVYRDWLSRDNSMKRFIECHAHEYLNESQLLSNMKFCFSFDRIGTLNEMYKDEFVSTVLLTEAAVNRPINYELDRYFPYPMRYSLDAVAKLSWRRYIESGTYFFQDDEHLSSIDFVPPDSFSEKEFLDVYAKLDVWRSILSIGVYARYVYLYYLAAWIVSPLGPFDMGYKLYLRFKEEASKRDKKRNEILNNIGGKR